MNTFNIKHFGPIDDVSLEFKDLTILIGPQASGKSIALETLKLAVDRDDIVNTLDRYNYIFGHNTDDILNVFMICLILRHYWMIIKTSSGFAGLLSSSGKF